MALSDPQSVTFGSVATSLPRTSTSTDQSTYTKADQTTVLTVAHSYGRRNRRLVRLQTSKITTDPLLTGQNINVGASARVVLDTPSSGFTVVEMENLLDALATWVKANKAKIVGGEN